MAVCVINATAATKQVQRIATHFIVGKGRDLRDRMIKLNFSH